MEQQNKTGALDLFRALAACLVVAIHISPLEKLSPTADHLLCGVLARIAVPFFFMLSGYFVLASRDAARTRRFCLRIALLYLFAILLYLPIGVYAGHYEDLSARDALRMLLFDGSFYHLWYFPALLLGVGVTWLLLRIKSRGAALAIAGALYLLGLMGDGYWGLASSLPPLRSLLEGYFAVSHYTRGGLFLAPLFLLLGATLRQKKAPRLRLALPALGVSLLLLLAEGYWLLQLGWQRHTAMYLMLPAAVASLFSFLRAIPVTAKPRLRKAATWIYLLHPAVIIAVRLFADLTGTNALLVETLPLHFLTVLLLSCAAAWAITYIPMKKTITPDPRARAWAEIDTAALTHNLSHLLSPLPDTCHPMPVLKANAYGHGTEVVTAHLLSLGVRDFCVANTAEGVQLRRLGVPGTILVLGYTHPSDFAILRRYRLTQAVVDSDYAALLDREKKSIRVHLALDTGMRRLGIDAKDTDAILAVMQMKHLRVDGIFTHLCTDDTEAEGDIAFTHAQADAFFDAIDALRARGQKIPKLHLQASYGVLNYPDLSGDYARIGIALYGVKSRRDDMDRSKTPLCPVLSLRARVATVRSLAPGESAGYGLAFTATRPTRLATVTVGYADGVPRALSNGIGTALLHGKRVPIVGRVCMDQLSIDVTDLDDVKSGDIVTLLGSDGDDTLSVYDWADACNTLTNEILSGLGTRPPRVKM